MKVVQQHYHCSICKHNNFETIYDNLFYLYKLKISICKNCGVVCQNPRMSSTFFNNYYSRKRYYGKYQPRISISKMPNIIDGSRPYQIYKHIKNFVSKKSSILEVGSGLGDTLILLKSKGFKKLGATEVNLDGVNRLRAFGIECHHGSLTSFSKTNKKYDLVILSHVLEHFVKPNIALIKIRKLLKKDGHLYILLPNLYCDKNPYTLFTLPHTFYFSKNTLNKLLRSTGFQTVSKPLSDHSEIAVVCKKTSPRKNNFSDSQYLDFISYLQKYKTPSKSKKELLANVIIKNMPSGIYSFLINLLS